MSGILKVKDGDRWVDIPAIAGSVQDVQIDGTSILDAQGVANVPVASNSAIGAVKVNAALGIGKATGTYENVLAIQAANSATIKSGAGYYAPVVAQRQHESTFYGLAKAAGVDEKDSILPVGQYTDEAKVAIRNMLGAGDASDVDDLKSKISSDAFIPEVEAGYYSATGAPQSASSNKEVRTGFYKVVGKRCYYIVEKSVSTSLAMWFAYVLEAMDGTKTRYTVSLTGDKQRWVGYIDLDPDTVKSFAITYRGFDGTVLTTLIYPYGDLAEKIDGLQPMLKPSNFSSYTNAGSYDNIAVAHEFTTTASARVQNFSANVDAGVYVIESTVPSGYSFAVNMTYDKAEAALPFVVVKQPLTRFDIYVSPSAVAGINLKLRKLSNDQLLWKTCRDIGLVDNNYHAEAFNVTEFEQVMRLSSLVTVPDNNTRISSKVMPYIGEFSVSLSAYTTYDFAITIYNRNTFAKRLDSGWKQAAYSFSVHNDECFIIVLRHIDNSYIFASEVPSTLVNVTPNPWYRVSPYLTKYDLEPVKADIVEIKSETATIPVIGNELLTMLRNDAPCYDHLHVNETGASVTIPHESLYHLRMSKNMGFKVIELNVQASSDGVLWVNHGSGGKFGGYFHHVDGTTDISNIATNSVTWDWVVQNVRYNSTIPKYQTRPATLEECLKECARCNLIPFVAQKAVTETNTSINMAKKVMGEMGFIAYGASREAAGKTPIFAWDMTSSTKEEVLAVCNTLGAPLIWGTTMSRFTDDEAKEIIDVLHENGYFVGISYNDTYWDKYRAMGVDFNGTQSLINRINDSNICECSSVFDWDDYTITGNPTNAGGYLTFADGGTITPNVPQDEHEVCGYDLEIVFKGSLSITDANGTATVMHDGLETYQVAKPVYDGSPSVTFTLSAGAEVQDLYFKATAFC